MNARTAVWRSVKANNSRIMNRGARDALPGDRAVRNVFRDDRVPPDRYAGWPTHRPMIGVVGLPYLFHV